MIRILVTDPLMLILVDSLHGVAGFSLSLQFFLNTVDVKRVKNVTSNHVWLVVVKENS